MTINRFLKIAAFLAILSSGSCAKASKARQARVDREEPKPQWPRKDELDVSLTVLYALEDGPFVCQVNLKNIGKQTLEYATDMWDVGAVCRVEAAWKAKKEPLFRVGVVCGFVGPYPQRLFPGDSSSHTFYLHPSFLEVPAGDVPVRFGWNVYRTRKTTTKESRLQEKELELLFRLERTQTVKVLPATKDNVAQVLRRLDADFAVAMKAVAEQKDYVWSSLDPTDAFVHTLAGCRRKEFIPLLLRAVDQLPAAQYRGQLIATVYESFATPGQSFDVLANYLDTSCPTAAVEVFQYWHEEEINHKHSARRQAKLREKRKHTGNSEQAQVEEFLLESTRSEEEAWRSSKRHLDTRLTKKQFDRLLALKNVWVRALLYDYFPDRCPAEWVRTLRADLLQVAQPPKRLLKLLDQLDDDEFRVREQASKEMSASRDAVIVYFWTVPKEKLSLEASRRLRQLMKDVDKPELPPLWRRTIAHLAWSDKPHSRQMLDILRKTDASTLIAQRAQSAFEERKKHDEEIKR